jgi:hypothetical protein
MGREINLMGPKPVAGEDQTGLTPDDRKLYLLQTLFITNMHVTEILG